MTGPPREQRRSRDQTTTLYYNDNPAADDPSSTVWISSLLESCASGMQLLGNSCDYESKKSTPLSGGAAAGGDSGSNMNSNNSNSSNAYRRKEEGRRRNNSILSSTVVGEDFASLHDDFLESLLFEASQEGENNNQHHRHSSSNHSVMDESLSSQSSAGFFSRLDSIPLEQEEESRKLQEEEERIAAARKRRRPLRLRKKNSWPALQSNSSQKENRSYQSFAPQEGNSSNNNNSYRPSSPVKRKTSEVSYNIDLENPRDEPHVFLHEHVRLQKDKGNGAPVGSNICAKGRPACLVKLRAKMRLLTEVAWKEPAGGGGGCGSSNASNASSVTTAATMKRKKARIALQTDTFTETRSLIELKMGFLSMTYGVLLRWDTTRTRTITLVVLRKNCHESFYPRLPKSLENTTASSSLQQQQHPSKRQRELTTCSSNVSSSSRQSQQRPRSPHGAADGGLDPPYLIPRPLEFAPTFLQVKVLYATGLNKRCNWTIQLLLQNRVESILLAYDAKRDRLYPKLGEALCEKLSHSSFTPSLPLLVPPPLEIKLWEHNTATSASTSSRSSHRGGRHHQQSHARRLVCAMRVSWDDLPITKSSKGGGGGRNIINTNADSTLVTVPCLHDVEHATIGLDVLFQSDYLAWLREELQAREISTYNKSTTPVPHHVSSLSPPPVACTSTRDLIDGCSPLMECGQAMANTTTTTSSIQQQQQQRGAISPQAAEEEEDDDVHSPWEWICSVC